MDDFKKPTKRVSLEPASDFKDPKVNPAEHDFSDTKSRFNHIPTVYIDADDNRSNQSYKPIQPGGNKVITFMKKKKVLIGLAVIILIITALAWFFLFNNDDSTNNTGQQPTVTAKKKEEKITSPLTGAVVTDQSLAKRPVTALMIENSPNARPQSGLTEAGIVYEAIAEGGVTRFMAVYQEAQPQYVGPVRSARPYYIDYALPLEASYGHVGGSPEALQDIKTLGVRDLDQFFNPDAYWRISERFSPHNMYTSFERLDKANQSKGYTTSKFTGFQRKPDVPQTPTAKIIDFSISGPLYSPRFEYNPTTNSYNRFQDSKPHNDEKSQKQISPKVVIGLVVNNGNGSDGYHSTYNTSGTGKAYVFQDGIVSEATWSKKDRQSPLELTDLNGLPLKLNAGQAWISLIGASADITYK